MAIEWMQAFGLVGVAGMAAFAGVIGTQLLASGKVAPRMGLFLSLIHI